MARIIDGEKMNMIGKSVRKRRKELKMSQQELSNKLFVSVPTLRRDLIKLEQMGKIVRTHGGARLIQKSADEKIPIFLLCFLLFP